MSVSTFSFLVVRFPKPSLSAFQFQPRRDPAEATCRGRVQPLEFRLQHRPTDPISRFQIRLGTDTATGRSSGNESDAGQWPWPCDDAEQCRTHADDSGGGGRVVTLVQKCLVLRQLVAGLFPVDVHVPFGPGDGHGGEWSGERHQHR